MCLKASRDTLSGIAPRVEKPKDEVHAKAGYSFPFVVPGTVPLRKQAVFLDVFFSLHDSGLVLN